MTGVAASNWIERAFFDVYASTVRFAMHHRAALRMVAVVWSLVVLAVSVVLMVVHNELHSSSFVCESLLVPLERDVALDFMLVDRFDNGNLEQKYSHSPLIDALSIHWKQSEQQQNNSFERKNNAFAALTCDAFEPKSLFVKQCAASPNAPFNVKYRFFEPNVFWRYRYMRESSDFGLVLLRPSTSARLRLRSRTVVEELANERCFGPYAWLVNWIVSTDTFVASRFHRAFGGAGVLVRRSVIDLATRPSAPASREIGEHLELRIVAMLKSVCEHVMAEASVEVIMRVLVPIVALELTWFDLDAQTRRVLASRAAIAGCLLLFGAVAVQSLMFDQTLLDNVFTVFIVGASLVTYIVSCGLLWHAWSRRLFRAAHFFLFLIASTIVEDSTFPPTTLWILWWFCCTSGAWLSLFVFDVAHLAVVVAERERQNRR